MEVFLILLLVVIICWLYKGLSSENVIELDEKLFNDFRYCNEYHRYMASSGIYDDTLDSDEEFKKYRDRVKEIEYTLPEELKEKLGEIKDSEFDLYYKIKE